MIVLFLDNFHLQQSQQSIHRDMQDRQGQNGGENNEQLQQQMGRKRMKLELGQGSIAQIDYQRIIHEKFDAQQIRRLVDHLKNLQNYYKFVSLQIQHQERSIATLPGHILALFPQMRERVQTMISKANYNVQFLDLVLFPYKSLVIQAILADRRRGEEGSEDLGHDHSCGSHHNAISNMFYHLVREWSSNAELDYCSKIVSCLDRHLDDGRGEKKRRILVVGFGMGRVLHQIRKRYGESVQLQGHETDTELYLCGQYFLNRCIKAHSVYPYLHNFCNYRTNNDPYRCLNIPSIIDDHSYYYPLTLGSFASLYRTHESNWDCIITIFQNYHMDNILMHLRLVYKMLSDKGLWIDLSTSNFDKNVIPFSYGEFERVLDRSQFGLLEKETEDRFWYGDRECLMNEMRRNYYRVMRKQ